MVKIQIDGKYYDVKPGKTFLRPVLRWVLMYLIFAITLPWVLSVHAGYVQ